MRPLHDCSRLYLCSVAFAACMTADNPVKAQIGALPQEQHMCQDLDLQGECVETNNLSLPVLHCYCRSLKKTIGTAGSAAYNYFSPNHTEADSRRHNCQGTYVHHNPHRLPFDYSNWQPPPYKQHYKNRLLEFAKPLVIMHNKYTWEWAEPPANFIDIPTLLELVTLLKPYYTVVYIRPAAHAQGYSADDNDVLEFNDHDSLKEAHPEVLLFHDLLKQYHEYDFNRLQLMLHANCDYFISVLGGNAVIASYFAGTNVVYAVKGHETEQTTEYGELYRRFAVDPEQAIVHRVKAYSELLEYVKQHYLPQ